MSNTARRTSLTYPNGRVLNLGYGSTGSVDDLFSLVKTAAIAGESGNKVEYARAGLGRFVKIAYPQPGVEMSMIRPGGGSMGDSGDPYDGYDRFNRVQEMRWQNSSTGTPIDAWQWGFNEASNRTWKMNLIAATGQDEGYSYDGLYQVIRDAVGTLNTNRTAIGGVPGEEEDFTYDPTGNWLGYRKDVIGSVVLDQSRSNNQDNQLTQIDGSSALHSYDRAGNATKTTPGANGDWSKYYQPVWDAWNRLVEVKDETGASVQKNAYDGLSRRITKESGGTVTHTYWSDRWKPLEERIGSATTAARSYLWGERPGHRDELVLRDRDTDGNGTLDERLYATMDYFNGTAMLNTSGTVLERYAYSAFGVRRIMAADFSPRSFSSYAWDFGFQGQFRDGETGWSNYGCRFYVPLLGRWINRDPIGERGGWNNYLMAGNNATGKLDILGLITDVDLEVLEHSRNPGGQGLLGAVYNQLRTIPPITIDSNRVGLVDGGASVGLLSELEKKACVCKTFEVDEVVFGVQTDHLWSIGRVNVKIVGTFTSTRKDGIDKWSFSGTFEPQNDSFDFEPLFDGRGTAAEIVNTAGWVAEKAGVFGTFEILFTGPVPVSWTRYRNCDE